MENVFPALFRQYLEESKHRPALDVSDSRMMFQAWMLRRANNMYVTGTLTAEEFAALMSYTVSL